MKPLDLFPAKEPAEPGAAELAIPSHPHCLKRQRLLPGGLLPHLLTTLLVLCLNLEETKASAPPVPDPPQRWVPGQLLVKPKHSIQPQSANSALARLGCRPLQTYPNIGWSLVELPEGITVTAAIASLETDASIEYVEPNYILEPSYVPIIPGPDPELDRQWGLFAIDAPEAWESGTGSPDIVVAVIDSGIKYDHEDLEANMWINPGESGLDKNGIDRSTNGIDDDDNGYIDDVHGCNIPDENGDPMDTWWHGTRVAGIIGATGYNSLGIAGVNWRVKLMALRCYDPKWNGIPTSNVVECYKYLKKMKRRGVNVRVTNNSFAFVTDDPPAPETNLCLRECLDDAGNLGILNICAAHNNGTDLNSCAVYPACYDSPSIITVGATMLNNVGREVFYHQSNYGAPHVDLAAPGRKVLTTSTETADSYVATSGTSFATPYVTGAAALLWSLNPDASPVAIKAAILSSAEPLPDLAGRFASNGRLNVASAAAMLLDYPDLLASPQIQILTGNTDSLLIRWPGSAPATLEATTNLNAPVWTPIPSTPYLRHGFYEVACPKSTTPLFFRLLLK